jgi:hypothetical protein
MFLGVENGTGNFLGKMLDPPTDQSIHAAIFSLQKLGAIMTDSPVEGSLKLTPLGQHLAGIPAPPPVGKSEFRRFLFLSPVPDMCSFQNLHLTFVLSLLKFLLWGACLGVAVLHLPWQQE